MNFLSSRPALCARLLVVPPHTTPFLFDTPVFVALARLVRPRPLSFLPCCQFAFLGGYLGRQHRIFCNTKPASCDKMHARSALSWILLLQLHATAYFLQRPIFPPLAFKNPVTAVAHVFYYPW
jgi:hypothetical protein